MPTDFLFYCSWYEDNIVTLDMQLYIKALQIVDNRPELKDKFILIIGQLHELFAQCRVVV